MSKIDGDYQYTALTEGNAVQRFWHYAKKLTIMSSLAPGKEDYILDAGCGSGVITSFLADSGSEVTGIDANPDAIGFAKTRYSGNNLTFQHGNINEVRLDAPLDKIYCLEVIEHIPINEVEEIFDFFREKLKPSGRILITTPNYRSMWPLIEYSLDFFKLTPPLRDHQHIELFHRKKLVALCHNKGFDVEKIFTTCLIAPWIAPVSWTFAEKLYIAELQFPFYMGSILNCILKKSNA